MSDFVHELRAANPAARQSRDEQLIAQFKERVRRANRGGATSLRLASQECSGPVWRYIGEQQFTVTEETTIGCGSDIVDQRDPDGPCCAACTNRVRVKHKRISWAAE